MAFYRKYCSTLAIFLGLLYLSSCSNSDVAVSASHEAMPLSTNNMTIAKPSTKSGDAATMSNKLSPPNSIMDYYLQVPNKYLASPKSYQERKLALEDQSVSVDSQNDYLEDKSAKETQNVLSLYQLGNEEEVLALNTSICNDYCCDHKTYFLAYADGQWENVTQQFLPEVTFKTFCKDKYENDLLTDLAKKGVINLSVLYKLAKEKTSIVCNLAACFEPDYIPDEYVDNILQNQLTLDWQENVFVLEPSANYQNEEDLITYYSE